MAETLEDQPRKRTGSAGLGGVARDLLRGVGEGLRNRSAPISAALICASMSPTTRSEARILSRRSRQTARFGRPSSTILIALNCSPSA